MHINTISYITDEDDGNSSIFRKAATSECITCSKTKILSHCYEQTKEVLNVRDLIILNLQTENKQIWKKVSKINSD